MDIKNFLNESKTQRLRLNKMSKEITEKTTIAKILNIKGSEGILLKYGLPCLHCPMGTYEMKTLKIGEVAKIYGIDIKNLLNELNKKSKR